jgi:type I restriction enzyme, S subunit
MESLPPGWTWNTVGDVAAVEGGLTKHADKRGKSQRVVPLVSVAAVHLREIRHDQIGTIGLLESDGDKATLLSGDLLVVEGNGSLGHIGRVALWDGSVKDARHQNHLIRVRPHDVDPRYVLEWLASPKGRAAIIDEATSAAGLYNLSLSKVQRLPIPLGPPDQQRRIVEKIDALTAKSRRAKEALNAIPPLLERFRQSVLAAAFRGDLTKDWREQNPDVEPADQLLARIRRERRARWEQAELQRLRAKGKVPKNDEWKMKYVEPEPVNVEGLPALPDTWCWAAWREVGFCQNGRAFPSGEYAHEGFRLLRPGNLHVSGRVQWTTENTRCMPAQWAANYPDHIVGGHELVMNLTAQSLKDAFLGRVCLTAKDDRCLLNQRLARLTPVGLSAEFALSLFKSPVFRRYVDDLNTGSLIQHMFTSQVDDFCLPLPPAAEQLVLVDQLRRADAHTSRMQESLVGAATVAIRLDASILAKAFRGELV